MSNVYLPNYSIANDAYHNINEIITPYGKTITCIGGHTALEKALPSIKEALHDRFTILETLWYLGESSYENVNILLTKKSVQDCDMLFAIGGGKACDTVKILGDKLQKPIFTFPTIAATCASITSLCAVYKNDGTFVGPYERKKPADHTFINTQIISQAPSLYLWAGIGDTLAKGFEPEISCRGQQLDNTTLSGITLSSLCYEPILEHAAQALKDCKKARFSYALEQIVSTIIVNTGIVSNYLPFAYNTALAHAICYGCTTIKEVEEKHLHGELVSYGLLVQLAIDQKQDILENLIPLYTSISLPTKLKDIDLCLDTIDGVIDFALQTSDVKQFSIPLSKQIVVEAIQSLETYK